MMIPVPIERLNRTPNEPKNHHDIVALKNFDFTNPRTWEAIETKGPARPFLGHGTWEAIEKKAVVGNVRNRNFDGDKLPLFGAEFHVNFKPANSRAGRRGWPSVPYLKSQFFWCEEGL